MHLCAMKQMVILASGNGSNAEALINHFKGNEEIGVQGLVTNNAQAGVIERAKRMGVPFVLWPNALFSSPEAPSELNWPGNYQPDGLVLAGFLRKIPLWLLRMFPNRIVNLHPALLPQFGGKGMYGKHVHNAVIQSGVTQSGITIHLVNEAYDEGQILQQYPLNIEQGETAEELAERIHALEHKHFPPTVSQYFSTLPPLSHEHR